MPSPANDECLLLLESLEKSGVFNSTEIRECTRRLLHFEESLQRKKKLHVDMVVAYVRYVQYFEHLHIVRAKKAGRQAVSLFRRLILDIFRRGLLRFYDSIKLWALMFSYVAKHGARRLISRSLVIALRMNPSSAALWAYAASWEFTRNANPSGARTLIQRGLRSCHKTRELWRQYFEIELRYTDLIQTRRQIVNSDQELLELKVQNGATLSIVEGNFALRVYEAAKSQYAGDFYLLFHFFLAALHKPWSQKLCKNIREDLWKLFPQNRLELALASYGKFPGGLDGGIYKRMLHRAEILENSCTVQGLFRLLNEESVVTVEQAYSGELLPSLRWASQLFASHNFISGRSCDQFRAVLGPVVHRVLRASSADIINSEALVKFHGQRNSALEVRTIIASASAEFIFLVGKTHLSPLYFFEK